MFALLSLVRFLIYVNLGLVGPRGTLFVSFIHPVNKNSSLVPEQQLTDDSQKWCRLFKPSSVYGHQAQCSIKVFILFHEEGHRVFLSAHYTPSLSEHCHINADSPGFGKSRCCRDLTGNQANSQCTRYLLQGALA